MESLIFLFFTKEEYFLNYYGDNTSLGHTTILGTHSRKIKNYFFFKKIVPIIAINLGVLTKFFKDDHTIIKSISKIITHECLHECLTEIDIKSEQHHWATERLGLNF